MAGMAQWVAVDWDVREARVVAGTLRGNRLRIEHAFRAPWPGATVFDADALAQRTAVLGDALQKRGLAKAEAIVLIGRAAVELKQLQLPPAPDAELPDMVRFLAQRELHALAAGGLLDFVPTPAGPNEPRSVMAAAVEPGPAAQVRQLIEGAGLKLRRMLLRPVAAASLTLRRVAHDEEPRLLVDPGAEEAEVAALAGASIVLVRSARMPGDLESADYRRALATDLRRTLASVQHQLGGRRVAAIELCGGVAGRQAMAEQLAADLGVTVDVVDAWSPLPAALELDPSVSPEEGRYAALLGALADEAEGAAPKLDFLNPHRAPEPPNRRRQVIVGAFCATLALALVWGFLQWKFGRIDDEIKLTRDTANAMAPAVKAAQELERKAKDIEAWRRGNVAWLDELERLSRQAPSNKVTLLTSLRLSALPQGGELQLKGVATEPSVVDELEHGLRDGHHLVEGKGRRHDALNPKYPWGFSSNVLVKPDAPPAAAQPKPSSSAAPSATAGGAR
ncbi:MAG: hypothetical protein C0483_19495 [Pirellula sp.]|nr:hypothetical protein [Pirellula sp.]